MDIITANLQEFLFSAVDLVAIVIEIWGLLVIAIGFISELIRTFRKYRFDFYKANMDNNFNHTLTTGLEILLAAEILKTITIRNFENLIIIGVLVILRIVMTLLLVWESDHREKQALSEKSEKPID
jgi:uncharacterized membrane protein